VSSLDRIVCLERARARRTQHPFAVLRLEAPGLDAAATSFGLLFADAARAHLCAVVGSTVRECDLVVPGVDGALALVLPETPEEGAAALASRLQASVRRAFADGFLGRRPDPEVRSFPRPVEAVGEDGPAPLPAGYEDDLDPLTGLAGERAFRAAVSRELRRARRYEGQVAVVLFDLDGFAAIDAALSRPDADAVVREAAALLLTQVRDVDLAARPGEDELALLLPGADRAGAFSVAERFRVRLERRFAGPTPVTVSGGVACYPGGARSAELLLERAARALYAAKAAGRNAVR